jgi:catalase
MEKDQATEKTHSGAKTTGAELSGANSLSRLLIIGVVVGGIAALFLYVGGWLSPHTLTPAGIVDTLQDVNGVHPGYRRNHAKGVCVSGYFEGNGNGVALSKALIFESGRAPVLGRFSFGGGQPDMADPPHAPRGLGLSFTLPDGEIWRAAMVNFPVFPVRTAQAFRDLLLDSAPDPATGKPDPSKMQAFMAKYPESAKALQIIGGHPMSSGFENTTFNSLNAFRFINASGAVTSVRWSFVPAQPSAPVSDTPSGQPDKNAMFDALIVSVHRQPLKWHLIVTVAQAGDPTDDATVPWPADRQQIDVGTLTIDSVQSDDTSPARDLTFDPLILPSGIAPSDDALLSARSAVYSQAFTRREGEPSAPAAVTPDETAR